jgi:CRISPR/Cas system type I-B associated protein Csh2 (Cas7 group RAMP superfamily)
MHVAVNPIALPISGGKDKDGKPIDWHNVNETKLQKLREQMEDPANKLDITDDLRIKGDVKDQIYEIKKGICEALIKEDFEINKEIRQLRDNKVDMLQIQSEDQEINLKGISMTSVMVYLNEVVHSNEDITKMSHLANPGQAIVDYINQEM